MDNAALVRLLPGPTRVLDTLAVPVTSAIERIRPALGAQRGHHELIGHSIGALTALRWAFAHPGQVSRVILLDPTDPRSDPVPTLLGGHRRDRPAGAGRHPRCAAGPGAHGGTAGTTGAAGHVRRHR